MTTPGTVLDIEKAAKAKLMNERADLYGTTWTMRLAIDIHLMKVGQLSTVKVSTEKSTHEQRSRYWLQPRVLTVKQKPKTETTLLGSEVKIPIGIGASSPQATVAPPEGDILTGKAAASAGTVMIFSSLASFKIESFGKIVPEGIYWAQTYLFRDRRNSLHIVRNAEKFGFKALVVTVDSPIEFRSNGSVEDDNDQYLSSDESSDVNGDSVNQDMSPNVLYLNGNRREDRNYSFNEIWHPKYGPGYRETFCMPTWDELAWLKSQTKLPIVLKGILTAEPARKAVSAGVDGIVVSAHGGRQLEGVPAPLMALPEVAEAVKGSGVEVYMDGGVRTGSDVFKAMALGAKAVFVGRPALWALAVNGEKGVRKMLKILQEELTTTMTMCGCPSLQEIGPQFVKHESEFQSKL